jgi:tRNA A-37 threonylcarbamoyl transferase component Bud32
VPTNELEEILTDLPRFGTLIKNRSYRQIWRFEVAGRPYFLKYYPRRAKGKVRGNPALREFSSLQQLQKLGLPAPRAVNAMVGYRLNGQIGDAVVMQGIEPSVALDQYLNDLELRGQPIPDRAALVRQVAQIVVALGRAGLGHNDLHLGNFLLQNGKVFLLDAYSIRRGGMRMKDIAYLGSSAARWATRTDQLRVWHALGQHGPMPARSKMAARYWRKFVAGSSKESDWFGRIDIAGWHGSYFKKSKSARRWSTASGFTVTADDWQKAWPPLWQQIQSGSAEQLKTSPSGDVWAGEIVLAGSPLPVVVKRPFKRYWYRYINEIGRGSRARRAWIKAWRLIVRNIPTAWPLLILEKRSLGYVTDSVIVFERITGPTLAKVELDALPATERQMLLRRTGTILRQIDALGLSHFDAKSSNWIVAADSAHGPRPMLIDVDGIRSRRWLALGINRLLRSLRSHPQYTPHDSLQLCQGYAPFSPLSVAKE